MRQFVLTHRRMLVFVAILAACAAIAAGFFDGAKVTIPAVSPQVASAVNDPGQEGAGGGCPQHVEWVCYQTYGGDNLFGDIYCDEEWVKDC